MTDVTNQIKLKLLLLQPAFGFWIATSHVCAQIIPDRTLPINSTVTEINNVANITDGTQVGSNLFHSFERFDIPKNTGIFFNHGATVENILTRVTGVNISQIDGLIGASGSANLFLLNPNGIVFGQNASLNISGSFVASSASTIKFADGTQFSSQNPANQNTGNTALLTISTPIGLSFGNNPGTISVLGKGHNLSIERPVTRPLIRNSVTGLQVETGKTLALIGGKINLNGGELTASSGHIELGSVGSSSEVSINPSSRGFSFGYAGTSNFDDIKLLQRAIVDVSGTNAGSIQLFARQVSLNDGSILWIQNQGTQRGGDINVNAVELVQLNSTSGDGRIGSGLVNETVLSGDSGDINVTTSRLELQQGSSISNKTFSSGASGNVNINAIASIRLRDVSPFDKVRTSGITALTLSTGNAGNVNVTTNDLFVLGGSSVASFTQGSSGASGNVAIKAANIQVSGVAPGGDRSTISSSSLGLGNAGRVSIDTKNLSVTNGGSVSSSGFSNASAGSVIINAADSVEIRGKSGELTSEIRSAIRVFNSELIRQLLGLPAIPQGQAGDVEINTRSLQVSDQAQVSVENLGIGDGGTLKINADLLTLERRASITANTKSGVGGNILIQSQDMRMTDNSQITATAQGKTGNGGNITIDSKTLVALVNSDITANAQTSSGGKIIINATGILGTQFRPFITPQSDITASSEAGVNGIVDINSFYFDSNVTIVDLPESIIPIPNKITAGCPASSGNKFIITGRGGLPENPTTTLRGETIWLDWRSPQLSHLPARSIPEPTSEKTSSQSDIVEATGWITDVQGKVNLVAQVNPQMIIPTWRSSVNCSR
ncbi:hypothetical protein NIES4101_48890 [Calothrix sp. NIES-4101]|nr:hypothetical protein NIES4101_48890 [Calothrix sp. NIES-4101]